MRAASRAELLELVAHPNLHEIGRRAQALRSERFGAAATVAAVEHFGLPGSGAFCPICGAEPSQRAWLSDLAAASPWLSELHVVPGPGSDAATLLAALEATAALPQPNALAATVQVGVAANWMAAGADLDELLKQAYDAGLRVVADGILPTIHPRAGVEAGQRWADFWTRAAAAGLRGHASILYASIEDPSGLLDQIEAVNALQESSSVFLSACPIVDPGESFGGVDDSLLSSGATDLRVMSACRLGLTSVEHICMLYNRSDLKLAHISLSTGIDDFEGHLILETRGLTDDANHFDMTLTEMHAWLAEVGYHARLRNGLFESIDFPAELERASADEASATG